MKKSLVFKKQDKELGAFTSCVISSWGDILGGEKRITSESSPRCFHTDSWEEHKESI